ncbi:ClpP/crotonase [Ascodesmis nigricans]|uniref:ClpP/crotonase n=1 Tax=Ascodesmis nigricans TaxID=341454 RepID=A0A4S2MWJ8_9PEZI|nr:ClpP/crotonase [Ascodesmis nigricans]
MAAKQESPVVLTIEKNIATITLNDPAKLNALSILGYYQLACALREAAAHPTTTLTLLTGAGRFFSAGADVTGGFSSGIQDDAVDDRQFWFRRFAANNIDVARAFYQHPKILIVALNGPAVGLSAALIAFADFIYCTKKTFIMTPFSSLGLVAEGGASAMFVKRMGIAKANEALILSKRITAPELLQCGFVNKVFESEGEAFAKEVREWVDDQFGEHLNHGSMIKIKKLIVEGWERDLEAANVREAVGGVERFVDGIPQEQFLAIASGEKKHKL